MNCQTQEQYQEIKLFNSGITKAQIFSDIFHETKRDIEVLINNNTNGVIENQYTYMLPSKILNFITAVTNDYVNRFEFASDFGNSQIEFKVSQVSKINVQKKYEFRSSDYNGDHSIEWILFMQIPYNSNDEHRMSKVIETGTDFTSKLEFVYNTYNFGTKSHCIELDKNIEGTLLMYPAYLKNTMYPFYTSDDYRVFLTGKIWTLNLQKKYVTGKQSDAWL